MMRGETVLVTGGTGFLGSHLVRRLAAEGCEVHVIVRPDSVSCRLQGMEDGIVQWHGDIIDLAFLVDCCRKVRPHAIYHLAADTETRNFSGDWALVDRAVATNVRGTLNLLRAATEAGPQLRCMVRTGTLQEYGAGVAPFAETQRELPGSPYSATLVAGAHLGQAVQHYVTFAVLTLRLTLIYGPDQATGFLIPGVIHNLLHGRPFRLTEGRQRRDYLYVDDFVDAALAAFGRDDLGGALINICTGRSHAIRDVATSIARMLDAENLLEIGVAPPRTADIADFVGVTDSAERMLGWKSRIGLAEGLAATVDWYRTRMAEAAP